ncbi:MULTISPECIES: hypothetical protein [unclassified Streptomyces]|uniref:hypothetical protein n=1 Tax=unclassified Streptomyces TaxID=2593676 RepID=UPI0011E7B224|nr:hypothetical protein [Streptomyces sp. sk2.1]
MSEQLLTHEDRRRDLPLLAAPDIRAHAMDNMRKRLAGLLDDPMSPARCRAAMDGQAVGRMVPSLPHTDTVPVDGGLRVRLTTARAVLEAGEDTVTPRRSGRRRRRRAVAASFPVRVVVSLVARGAPDRRAPRDGAAPVARPVAPSGNPGRGQAPNRGAVPRAAARSPRRRMPSLR